MSEISLWFLHFFQNHSYYSFLYHFACDAGKTFPATTKLIATGYFIFLHYVYQSWLKDDIAYVLMYVPMVT